MGDANSSLSDVIMSPHPRLGNSTLTINPHLPGMHVALFLGNEANERIVKCRAPSRRRVPLCSPPAYLLSGYRYINVCPQNYSFVDKLVLAWVPDSNLTSDQFQLVSFSS